MESALSTREHNALMSPLILRPMALRKNMIMMTTIRNKNGVSERPLRRRLVKVKLIIQLNQALLLGNERASSPLMLHIS